eukprot:c5314_g1_i2.p1 GENE.c5314_g1_i2~~c5314_g1_i2.p1  ORF type:complete len:282 (-),score=70.60 c5314_g1_i2:384-1193(-)
MDDDWTEDIKQLREYVVAGEDTIASAPEGQVRLEITHSVLGGLGGRTNMFKNFRLDCTIFEVKELVHLHVGTSPEYMKLVLKDRSGKDIAMLLEDSLCLGYFSPQNGWLLHVEDRDPTHTIAKYQDLRNLSEEDRFKYTDEQYNQRPGTLREFLRNNPEAAARIRAERGIRDPEDGKELAEQIQVGQRCEVQLLGGGKERGEVKYIGLLEGNNGYYIGVQLDLPEGRNDGSVKGKRYFTCADKYGIFVMPDKVTVGDFPEEDFLASDNE